LSLAGGRTKRAGISEKEKRAGKEQGTPRSKKCFFLLQVRVFPLSLHGLPIFVPRKQASFQERNCPNFREKKVVSHFGVRTAEGTHVLSYGFLVISF
jgi:hypothetical protein